MIALVLATALAGDLRVGLFVGNDSGAASQDPLLFATSDAEKMRERFIETGGIREDNAVLLADESRRDVVEALRGLRLKVEQAEADGDDTLVIFYYSGHGDAAGLQMGTSTLLHEELRSLLDATKADVRIAILDACQSGAAVRQKGAVRGPAAALAVDIDRVRGTAFLTSSAANEFSQESAEIGGGFFTHYLHTALAGAADLDADGTVSLAEAYAFVHTETAFSTREAAEQQTPTFDLDIVGSGDVWLTQLDADTARLSFPGDMPGTYAVWDDSRRRYVAEIEGSTPTTVAVPAGVFYVQHRLPAFVEQAQYVVDDGQTSVVSLGDFAAVAYHDTASRGPLERQIRRAKMPDLQLQAVFGSRGFGNNVTGNQYLPAHALAGVRARWLRDSGPYVDVDILGGGGNGVLALPQVGAVDIHMQSTSFGAGIGFATKPNIVRAGIGARAELIGFARDFPDGEAESQSLFRPSFGVEPWAGIHYGRFSFDVGMAYMLLPTRFDDRSNWPIYGELTARTGIRF
ncbi:MAG: hypothetical protein ACJAZO_002013 [Myxococcota bacterium]